MPDKRLIDANALEGEAICLTTYGGARYIPLRSLQAAPTIDAVPVVHARWVKDTYNGRTCCSACKVALPGVWYYNGEDEDENYEEIDSTLYCPNCGAKMDGGAEDE